MKIDIDYPDQKRPTARVVIHHWDLWQVERTLARVIGPVIRKLIEKLDSGNGRCPGSFTQSLHDAPDDISVEAWNAMIDEGIKDWREVLSKILWAMDEIVYEKNEPDIMSLRPEGWTRNASLDGMMKQLEAPNGVKVDVFGSYHHLLVEYEQKIQEGCELLGKHFRALYA